MQTSEPDPWYLTAMKRWHAISVQFSNPDGYIPEKLKTKFNISLTSTFGIIIMFACIFFCILVSKLKLKQALHDGEQKAIDRALKMRNNLFFAYTASLGVLGYLSYSIYKSIPEQTLIENGNKGYEVMLQMIEKRQQLKAKKREEKLNKIQMQRKLYEER